MQAPIGVAGFAIVYVIDNGNGTQYEKLQLDPRLLAKLLTESYPGTNNVQTNWQITGLPAAAVLGIGDGSAPTSGSFEVSWTGSTAKVAVGYNESDSSLQNDIDAAWGGSLRVTGGPLPDTPITIVGIEASQLSISSNTLDEHAVPSVTASQDPAYCPQNCNGAYAAAANNPLSIFDDPSFWPSIPVSRSPPAYSRLQPPRSSAS